MQLTKEESHLYKKAAELLLLSSRGSIGLTTLYLKKLIPFSIINFSFNSSVRDGESVVMGAWNTGILFTSLVAMVTDRLIERDREREREREMMMMMVYYILETEQSMGVISCMSERDL